VKYWDSVLRVKYWDSVLRVVALGLSVESGGAGTQCWEWWRWDSVLRVVALVTNAEPEAKLAPLQQWLTAW